MAANDDAKKILEQIQKNNRTKKNGGFKNENPYSYLLVFKFRRVQLALAILLAVAAGTFMLHIRTMAGETIHESALLLLGIASLLILVPMTEEWFYGPWQEKPQIVEKLEFEK